MNIDLTQYVVAKWGTWFVDKEAFTPNELRLGTVRDGVTLAGPLCIRVAVQARNQFTLFGTSAVALQARDVFSYKLDIPPGQTWTYPAPRALRPSETTTSSTPPLVDPAGGRLERVTSVTGIIVDPVLGQDYGRDVLWGANAGFGIAIRPCGPDLCADPCAPDPCRPVDPCAPKKECHCGGKCGCAGGCGGGCGCGCHEGKGDDLPCDFATGAGSRLGMFFPAACEPCAPGAFVGMPVLKGPALMVPAARGGTVRTRYFNGMFITKEDLWTDQNNNRIKHALMNRAMGQGVVWGFDVRLDGDAVCVFPGYGVDCCGNDIVVSCAYRVDSQALLRDPAAARPSLSTGTSRRMSLLLEYYECPEEPRPVHGDPCAPDSVRCEMSRIRETARLRLVPPCDVDTSGCIKDFLDEVKKLKGDSVVGPILTTGLTGSATPIPAPVPATPSFTTSPATSVPFQITVKGLTQVAVDPAKSATYTIKYNAFGTNNVTIAVDAAAGAPFTAGSIQETKPAALTVKDPIPGLGFTWSFRMPFTEEAQSGLVDVIQNWHIKQGDDEYAGNVTLELRGVRRAQASESSDLTIVVTAEATVTRPDVTTQPPSRFPCWSEACDPLGRPRFPVAIPWLHEDPRHPGQAADPKVIVLAIFYALVVSRIAQSGPGTTDEVRKEQEALARALSLSAWKLLYDDVPKAERLDLMDAFRRLLQCWCKALLYPGPRCECGCDPHGVVIGCALIEGGTIRMVDPWGGRRWVVHYPLLAYWGKQFGIQPLDALASKFFDLICCVANLFPEKGTTRLTAGTEQPIAGLAAPQSAVVPLGASALIFDEPASVPAHLARMGVVAERTVELGTVEFIAQVMQAINAPGAPSAPGTPVVHYTVRGLPQLHFIAPAAGALPSAPAGPAVPGQQPGSRLGEMVRTAIANRPARSSVASLLRPFAEELTRRLLGTIPLEATSDAGRSVRDALAAAGIRSVAQLLDSHPEELHVDVLNRANAAGLAQLLEESEKSTVIVAKGVGDTVHKLSSEGRLVSREDLRAPELGGEFKKALLETLRGVVPPDGVAAEVDSSVGRAG
ncbi:MAG TPA: hypothetical protein VLH41_09045 [Thermoanaerobaculia bacterium]|nr:hypothetical protein [Thermoanaerobaculia bacterium]